MEIKMILKIKKIEAKKYFQLWRKYNGIKIAVPGKPLLR